MEQKERKHCWLLVRLQCWPWPPDIVRFLELGLDGAEDTRLAYATDLVTFEAYCLTHQFTLYLAAVTTLAGYVAHIANLPRKLATITRHLAAIQKEH